MLMEPLPDRFSNRLESILEPFGVPKWFGRGQEIVIGRTAGCNFESKNDVDPFSDDFWTTFGPFWKHFQSLQRQFLYNFCYLYYARCYLIDTY